MTLKEMVVILIHKGFSREYAETIAPLDKEDLDKEGLERDSHPDFECSVCRRSMSAIHWRYHYHPCE